MHNDKKAYQVDRTPTELLSDLLVQLKFLRQECLHYDAGDWSYGAQIATKLRLLLHQTKYSDSLLAQITKRFAFSCPDFLSLSTVRGELPNKGRTDFVRSPLIQYQMIHQPEVPPVLTVQPLSLEPGKRYAKRAFKTWWDGIDILLIDRQHFLSRKGVVCLAGKPGGWRPCPARHGRKGGFVTPESGKFPADCRPAAGRADADIYRRNRPGTGSRCAHHCGGDTVYI